ncbi:uncharacterized protein BO95DRAFT_72163 [Aspergillus brunneoviolaceus CBS 621.78]|uniref:Uncharacterized protein n=1 Tax=Aspergillus brunneoviolaceus CBS 621.78 TaxID=1450534 RepID=A0ACD1GF87_9EURO|nr:hypothetical protein BO95DRAFT_72163 [Aspergillus brunneoviolaceus CBS 621.78]RAH47892.1 hypothetical protein BO95DRAFT_72163 [Aspergillus brunneoviolaceus CBS 621.78]
MEPPSTPSPLPWRRYLATKTSISSRVRPASLYGGSLVLICGRRAMFLRVGRGSSSTPSALPWLRYFATKTSISSPVSPASLEGRESLMIDARGFITCLEDAIEVLPKVHATRGREVLEDEVVTPMGRWMIDIAVTRIGWPLWESRMCLRDDRHKTAPTPVITPARVLKFRVALSSVTVVVPDRDLHAGGPWPRLPEQRYCQQGLRDAAV